MREALLPHPLTGVRQMEIWQQARSQRMGVAQSLREKGFRISFYREFLIFSAKDWVGLTNIVSPKSVPHQFHTIGHAVSYLQGAVLARQYTTKGNHVS